MELTQAVQTLGPGSRVPSGPSGIPWVSESPGSKGADQALKELTTHSPGDCGPRAHGAPAGRAWAQGFLRMLEEWSQSDSRYLRWAGLPLHTQPLRHEPSAPQGRPSPGQGLGSQERTTSRAAPTSARTRAPAIKTFRLRASAPPAAPPPRYPLQAHLRLRGHPWSGPGRVLRYQ